MVLPSDSEATLTSFGKVSQGETPRLRSGRQRKGARGDKKSKLGVTKKVGSG
jgi:hypothetical protein